MVDASKDPINHPSHYNAGKIEVIEFIEDQGDGPGFCRGNAIKYISRAGKKIPKGVLPEVAMLEDLKKARWYLNRLIAYCEHDVEGKPLLRPNDMNQHPSKRSTIGCTTCDAVYDKVSEQGDSIRQTGECIPCVMKRKPS